MTSFPPTPFRFALIGAGRVGTAVALLLKVAGHEPVAVASRTRSSAEAAAARLGSAVVPLDSSIEADVYLIGTGLEAVARVAGSLASLSPLKGHPVWHFAGAGGIEVLRPALDRGAVGYALHPVQACPDVDTALARLPGSSWGVTCTPGSIAWAETVIKRDLGGRAVQVREQDRPAWHAAAVVTSNGIAALMAAGEALLADLGIEDPHLVLGPLAAGTVTNALEGGGAGDTLTGPIVRGELETIRSQLDALGKLPPGRSDAYRNASELVLQEAVESKRIDGAMAARIAEVLR